MSQSPSVLIVQPSAETREVLRTVLERRGLNILETGDAHDGLRLAHAHHPDVIVVDLDEMNVDQAALQAEFEAESTSSASSLIILGKVARHALPADQVLAKPYHFAPLVHKIEQLAAKAA